MTKNSLVRVFTFNQTLHWFMTGLIIPVLTLLLLEKGLDLFQAGIALGTYSTLVILFEIPTGGLADSLGRKRVYLISLVVSFCATTCLLIFKAFAGLLVGFALMGIARALSSGTLDAWFVDEFRKIEPEGNLQAALARAGTFIPLGLGAGALLGGILPMNLGQIISRISLFDMYSSNLLVVLCLGLLQYLLTSVMIHDPNSSVRDADLSGDLKKFPTIISNSIQYGVKNRIVFLLMLTSTAWGLGISGVELLWQPQVKHILGSDSQTWIFGLISAGYFVACGVGSYLSTPICTFFRNHNQGVLAGARIFMGASLFMLALQGNLAGFTGMYWGLFVFNGVMNSPHAAIFNENITENQRSTLLSFDSFMLQIGGLIGSIGFGYISETFSISNAWFVGAGILALSSLFYFFLPKRTAPTLS